MKPLLDWQSKEVVNIYDELSLWSAPFGQLLMEKIPIKLKSNLLDLGFGTGFPLVELAQRLGSDSSIYGMDVWEEAIQRTKEKIRVLELENIKILSGSAEEIPLDDDSIDIICSNLGVNNFEQFQQVLQEVHRVLKPDGSFCFTTNDNRTFQQLYDVFTCAMEELGLDSSLVRIQQAHRKTSNKLIEEIQAHGFVLHEQSEKLTSLRFMSGQAVFDHALIRCEFRSAWDQFKRDDKRDLFYDLCETKINKIVFEKGLFEMDIPIIYLCFKKIK
jgi:ubiquinone/menaquinone biosynthesis C-methylase UbiE